MITQINVSLLSNNFLDVRTQSAVRARRARMPLRPPQPRRGVMQNSAKANSQSLCRLVVMATPAAVLHH